MAKLALEALKIALKDVEEKVREIPRYSNRGPRVDLYLKTAGVASGNPYCMSAVYTWFQEASLKYRLTTPVIKTGYCPTGVDNFLKRGLVRKNSLEACPGDIIFYWMSDGTRSRFSHTGIVAKNLGNGILSVAEANTNDNGAREGDGVYLKTRKLNGKHIVINMQGFEIPDEEKIPEPVSIAGVEAKLYPVGISIDGDFKPHLPAYICQGKTLVGISDLETALAGRGFKNAQLKDNHLVDITLV